MNTRWLLSAMLLPLAIGNSVTAMGTNPTTSTNPAAAGEEKKESSVWYKSPRVYLISPPLAFLFISAFLLSSRSSVKNFEPKGNWRDMINIEMLRNNPQAYKKNLYHIFWDRWIGQKGKGEVLKSLSDGTIKPSESCPACGVMGQADAYLKNITESSTLYIALTGLALFAVKPETLAEKLVPEFLRPQVPNAEKKDQKQNPTTNKPTVVDNGKK